MVSGGNGTPSNVGLDDINSAENDTINIEKGETYSSAEVEVLLDEAKAEGRKSVLDSIKESLQEGNTVISVLKSLYPEYIVVAANQKYNFAFKNLLCYTYSLLPPP